MQGLFKHAQSKIYYTKVKGVVETTGTPDFKKALDILRSRQGWVAEGQPILRGLDQIKYAEARKDLIRHYTTTKTRDLEEAGDWFKNLDAFFQRKKIKDITPALVTRCVETRQEEGAADKTIDNELEVLIKMLCLAYEHNKLLRLPVIYKLKVNNVRKGFFGRKQFDRVCLHLPDDYIVAITIDLKILG